MFSVGFTNISNKRNVMCCGVNNVKGFRPIARNRWAKFKQRQGINSSTNTSQGEKARERVELLLYNCACCLCVVKNKCCYFG